MIKKLFFMIILLFFYSCFDEKYSSSIDSIAPLIEAKNLNGKKVYFDDEGLVVLVFFENGCSICIKELPLLNDFAKKNKVQIIAINSVDDIKTIKNIKKNYNLNHIIFLKDELDVSWYRYDIFALPTIIIIKDGIIKDKIIGNTNWQDLYQKFASLL